MPKWIFNPYHISTGSFEKQFATPGLAALRARAGNEVVGGHLWFVQGDVAYSHLASSNDRGYRFGASYALYWEAIQYFRGRVRWLNIGSGAGIKEGVDDGLTQFKRGWSNATRPVFFCSTIYDQPAYDKLCLRSGKTNASSFPAYRAGEF